MGQVFQRMKEKSLSKRKDSTDRTLEYCQLNQVKTCLIFWVAGTEQVEGARRFTEKFKEMKIDEMCFLPNKTDVITDEHVIVFRNSDLKFLGKIQNNRLMELLAQKHDLLIDLSTESNALSNYVLEHSMALCKVGTLKEGFEPDIVIEDVSGSVTFVEKMVEVLSKLKKY